MSKLHSRSFKLCDMYRYIAAFILLTSIRFCPAQVTVVGPGGMVVQMDTTTGAFALGDSSGKKLMFNFNYPWTHAGNWLTFISDDDKFTNSNSIAMEYGYTNLNQSDYFAGSGYWSGSVSKVWSVPYGTGRLYFRITVTPMEIDRVGVAKITLQAFNNDNVPHELGAMMQMDILVGENDKAPFATGTNFLDHCSILEENEVPHFWQAYEEFPGAGCEQVIARGFLQGLGTTTPDMFILADLLYLWRQPWDVETFYEGEEYHDSAVLLKWKKQRTDPKKWSTFVTYYGFGKCIGETTAVLLIPLIPGELTTHCSYVEPRFEAAALIHNLEIVEGISAGTLCVDIPPGTELAIDQFHIDEPCLPLQTDPLPRDSSNVCSWLVRITDNDIWGTTIPVVLNLHAEPDIAISSTSWVSIPSPDGVEPTVNVNFPYTYISCSDSGSIVIPFYLHDDTEIDLLSISVRLGDELFSLMSGYLRLNGDTLWAELPSRLLEHGNAIACQFLSVSDIFGCAPGIYPPPGTLRVDLLPPEFHRFDPPSGSDIGQVPQIRIHIVDFPSGVDHSSVQIYFDTAEILPDDPRISWENDSALVFTSSDTFPIGYPLAICLSAVSDNAELCGANVLSTLEYAIYTVSDISEAAKPPSEALLWANPNPFNDVCRIFLSVPDDAKIRIDILDISGHMVANLWNGHLSAGTHRFRWAAGNCPSGIYFAIAEVAEEQRIVRRIAMIR